LRVIGSIWERQHRAIEIALFGTLEAAVTTQLTPYLPSATIQARTGKQMSVLQRIRQLVIDRRYYLSAHAEEEMWADGLERPDLEWCILRGHIEKRMTEDVRGTRYRIEGPARDERLVHVVCRFHEVDDLLIITVYAVEVAL
jgi:hypothetical protein